MACAVDNSLLSSHGLSTEAKHRDSQLMWLAELKSYLDEHDYVIVMALRAVLARSISAIDSEYKRVWQAIDIFIQIYLYLGELDIR